MGKNSRNKKGKAKQPLIFAKNKKQAVLAIVVIFLFIANTIYTVIKIYNENNPQLPGANQDVSTLETNNPAFPDGKMPSGQTTVNQDTAAVATADQTIQQDANNIYSQTVGLQKDTPGAAPTPVSAQNPQGVASGENDVDIMQKKPARRNNQKLVMISVSSSGRQDPFLPADDGLVGVYSDLTLPPQTLPENSETSKIITTTISGILYDKYSPSAIINIEGTDYLVKKGDVINKYRILSINKSQVAVQLGKNIYKAGVGELLSVANDNNLANINKKFGGNDVSINVRRKGY